QDISLNGLSQDFSGGAIVNYQWVQTAGPTVIITDPSSPTLNFSAPIVQSLSSLEFELTVIDDSGLSASDRVSIYVKPGTSYYSVLAGDSWQSIALSLYGTADVVDELQAKIGTPILNTGTRLYYLPSTISDIQAVTIAAAPHYQVQAGDTWNSIALSVYGTSNVADELQALTGSPALLVGVSLTDLPETLGDIVSVPPYYRVQQGDSWSSIAAFIYGSPALGSELEIALGSPVLSSGLELFNLPETLSGQEAASQFYRVQSGDTWASLAANFYGTVDVADELQAVMANTSLTAGKLLSGLPDFLTTTVSTSPYYKIQQGDTWSSIAQALYGTSAVSDELQASLSTPVLTTGSQLSNLSANLINDVTAAYQVQTGDTWQIIAQAVYGDARAGSSLQETLGNIELVVGDFLTVPSTLTYTV
ncbi:hypothetical protein MNBD_GAMMA12-2194, partial [hydrothermal vent metagenome]